MRQDQWEQLNNIIQGKTPSAIPVGFIVDSPWLPGWAGISTLDYFAGDELWFQANKKAVETFPEVMFLPGFWAEYGMCTEPSAFGSKCSWHENELPFAEKVIHSIEDIDRLAVPRPETDGLGPFVISRLCRYRKTIEQLGHHIRFSVARGPLNIASFLMGTTEFLIALRTDPEKIHKLLQIVVEYTVKWLRLQKKTFDTIDGILILDDIVGFCGQTDFEQFASPYLKEIFGCLDVSVRFFHNDADGRVCAPYLAELGINMFNFSFLHTIKEMKQWTQNKVVLVGNFPGRDVLAQGGREEIRAAVQSELEPVADKSRLIFSCGGGMPDGVSTENMRVLLEALRQIN